MVQPPIVMVVWEDAKTLDATSWVENRDHTYKPHLVFSVGFLLSDTENGVILTQAWNPELIGARDQIPKSMIRSMTFLSPEKIKKSRQLTPQIN